MEAGDRKDEDAPSDTEQERRRDEVLRRMLNTPPKPHKAGEGAKKEEPRDARTSPGPRSGKKRQEDRGEHG